MAQAAIPVRGTSQLHLGWLGIGALLVVVALLSALVGYLVAENRVISINSDQALIDQANTAWSGPYDAAKIAAVYAPDAIFYDKIANETSAGLEAIQAKAATYAGVGFTTALLTKPVRTGDFVAAFAKYGTNLQATDTALILMQVKDGKIANQWVYPVS